MEKYLRPEHPMPQFFRESWLNLNGEWEFYEDYSVSGTERGAMAPDFEYPLKINVPFCRESILSGLGHTDFCESVWYRKKMVFPNEFTDGKRLLLHIGACDYRTTVYVNGITVTEHIGGYVPVNADITDHIRDGENTIVIHALDFLRDGTQPGGKQSVKYYSHGCSYTRTTGIWQTVWLEAVPCAHITNFKFYPSVEEQKLSVDLSAKNADGMELTAVAFYDGVPVGAATSTISGKSCRFEIPLSELHLWEIGEGRLYEIELTLGKDNVKSYFGMRSISCEDGTLILNGKKIFQRLVLDQGFYPDGIYTAREDSELEADVLRSIDCGFHGARLHQKIFEPRFLWYCDKHGYIVWGEHGNWGLDVSRPEAWQGFIPEWCEAVERDFNHPSIIGWCPLNETQSNQNKDLVKALAAITRSLDSTRLYIDASGWTHIDGVTDIMDMHKYEQSPEKMREILAPLENGEEIMIHRGCVGKPTFISEYGGIRWPVEGDGWGYGESVKSEEEFIERFTGLAKAILDNKAVSGLCYTQLTDVEQEINGLYYYDRRPKFDLEPIRRALNAKAAIESETEE